MSHAERITDYLYDPDGIDYGCARATIAQIASATNRSAEIVSSVLNEMRADGRVVNNADDTWSLTEEGEQYSNHYEEHENDDGERPRLHDARSE